MSQRGQWVCTRCCRRLKLESLGVRFRFGGESCPRCDDPGSGMEYVPSLQKMDWDLSDVSP